MSIAIATPEELKQFFSYDSESGILTWKVNKRPVFAGDVAGTVRRDRLMVRLHGRSYYASRVAWALHYGEWPKQLVDHINRNPMDNRIVNLRDVSFRENSTNSNRRSASRHCPATAMGVKKDRRYENTFIARIGISGRQVYLGTFRTEDEAAAAYQAARSSLPLEMLKGKS